jgi:hypothetical protein
MVVESDDLCMSPPPSSFGGLSPNPEFGLFLLALGFEGRVAIGLPGRWAGYILTPALFFPYNSGLFLNLPAERAQGEPAQCVAA